MFTNNQIKKILINSSILSEKKYDKFLIEAKKQNKKIINFLIEKKIITNLSLYKNVAKYFKLPFINLKKITINKKALFSIAEPITTAYNLIAFDANDKEIKLATSTPNNFKIFEFIKQKTNLTPIIHIATPDLIEHNIKKYHKNIKSKLNYLIKTSNKKISNINSYKQKLKKISNSTQVIKIVDTLFEYAIYQNASDIHIEPTENNTIVRYRIDGLLHNEMTLSKNIQLGVIARIKTLSNLNINENYLPQDGRFKIHNDKYKVTFLISTIPTLDGEKIVIQILNEKMRILNIEQLGLQSNNLEIIKKNINKQHGMILITGSADSGKTTSIYTILNMLNTPKINISTIEDPIEYRIQKINQSQINPKIGFTFEIGLRSLLRQDPNVIMVGEIQNKETAKITINASTKGHFVISALQATNAIATVNHLKKMEISSFLIATSINIIVAQQLVRKICPHCIKSYNLNKEDINEFKKQFNTKNLLGVLKNKKIISKTSNNLESLLFYKGNGCDKCNGSGYNGRIGIYEILEITKEISNLISENKASDKIKKEAKKQGMTTIVEDCFIKAKNGITTIEEMIRIAKQQC